MVNIIFYSFYIFSGPSYISFCEMKSNYGLYLFVESLVSLFENANFIDYFVFFSICLLLLNLNNNLATNKIMLITAKKFVSKLKTDISLFLFLFCFCVFSLLLSTLWLIIPFVTISVPLCPHLSVSSFIIFLSFHLTSSQCLIQAHLLLCLLLPSISRRRLQDSTH